MGPCSKPISLLIYLIPVGPLFSSSSGLGLVKPPETPFSVIPAKAGIQSLQAFLDSRLRGSDDYGDFLQVYRSSIIFNKIYQGRAGSSVALDAWLFGETGIRVKGAWVGYPGGGNGLQSPHTPLILCKGMKLFDMSRIRRAALKPKFT